MLGGRCAHVSGLFDAARTPLAFMLSADQIPIKSTRSKRSGIDGFAWPPVRPVLHDFVIALSNLCARRDWDARSLRGLQHGLAISLTLGHQRPDHPRDLVGERDRGDL